MSRSTTPARLARDLVMRWLADTPATSGVRGALCGRCGVDCGAEAWCNNNTRQLVCAGCAALINVKWAGVCTPHGNTVRRTDEELAVMRAEALAQTPVRRDQLVNALVAAARALTEFDATDVTESVVDGE